jgi:transposase InsO family protein
MPKIPTRGKPEAIRLDNGPELASRHFLAWAVEWQIELRPIQPGKPTQNAHVESFHGRSREECRRVNWFVNLFDARRKIAVWRQDYNEQRPQQSRQQDASRVRQGLQKGELWERRRLRLLGKRLRRFPLCHSSGCCGKLIPYHPVYGFKGQINAST